MLDQHPFIRNAGVLVGFISIVGGAVMIAWNMYAESERSVDQTTRLESIQKEQVDIRKELNEQTLRLSEIEGRQTAIQATQWRLSTQMNQGSLSMAVEIGRLLERTEK